MSYNCCICDAAASEPQTATVHSNVRAFASETFAVWRCPSCRSIHSRDEVDLAPYYAQYPFFKQHLNGLLRAGYRRLTRRLRRAGLAAGHSVIDYGCGSGLLVQYLNECGFSAVGYDPYSAAHGDTACLENRYDFVIAQDVIEHAADPRAVLATLDSLAAPGAAIAIGTPNASGIDLARAAKFIHPLHQPYHRHILSIEALRKAGESLGWQLERYYPTPYTNMPVLSLPFLHHYMRHFDGTIDTLFDMPLASAKLWLNPKTYALLVVGYFLCDDADVVAIFRK
ncbi:MAG: class I SAM-dependent methyltransferase [Planctomycetaceae bacterium]|nr:class I SAM-dependent methyltransferase [Planctomycetaceae bacterium]